MPKIDDLPGTLVDSEPEANPSDRLRPFTRCGWTSAPKKRISKSLNFGEGTPWHYLWPICRMLPALQHRVALQSIGVDQVDRGSRAERGDLLYCVFIVMRDGLTGDITQVRRAQRVG